MAVLRLPKGRCDHIKLIEAIHDAHLPQDPATALTLVVESRYLSCGALAMLCAWGLQRIAAGARFSLSPSAHAGELSYLARMDLFQHLAIPFAESFERHDPDARFLPLLAVGPAATRMSDAVAQLIQLIKGHFLGSEQFLPALSWIAQELVDNIANHAQSSTPGVICAQFYPSKRQLEIAIWDAGVGLFQSLSPAFPQLFSHGDAISKALEPGVTRDPNIGQGNGLAGSLELVAANGGQFQLWSGNATYRCERGKASFKLTQNRHSLPGTGLLLSLRTDSPLDLSRLSMTSNKRFLKTGSAEASRLLRLADEDTRGGRSAARALRQRLLAQLKANDAPFTVDFQDVPPLAHSYLDELFGRIVPELGGYTPFLEQVQLDHIDDWTLDVLHHVLIQRHGQPPAAAAAAAVETGPPMPEPLRANLPLICNPATVILCGQPHELPLSRPWIEALWPQAQIIALRDDEDACCQGDPPASTPRLLVASLKAASLRARCVVNLAHSGPLFVLAHPYELTQRESPWRSQLFEADALRSLVILPCPFGGNLPATSLALVGLGPLRAHEAPHSLAFFDGQALCTLKAKGSQELTRLLLGYPCQTSYGYRFCLPSAEHQLDYHQDHPEQRRKDQAIQTHLGLVTLAELVLFGHDGISAQSLGENSSGLRAVSARELGAIHQLSREEYPSVASGKQPEVLIAAGDLLYKAIGGGLAVVAAAELVGMAAAYGVIHLRPKQPAHAATLADFLMSEWFSARLFKARLRASAAELLASSIPNPESGPIKKLQNLACFSHELRQIADDFDRTRRNLLEDDLSQQLQKLAELELLAEVLAQTSRAYQDFGSQVELFYPQPLAEAWRKIQLQTSIEGRWEAYFLALETAVQFTACIMLAGYRHQGNRLAGLPQLFLKLASSGPTLGEWTELLGQCKRDGSLSAFPDLERLLVTDRQTSPWWKAQQLMRELRNEKSHHRGPRTGLDYENGCAQAQQHLEIIYRGLSFLSRTRLIEILGCQLDPLTETRTAQVRELVGDHPDIKIKQRPLNQEQGPGLYLEDDQANLHLISPWLIYQECPHHHKHEVFNPEHQEGDQFIYKGVYCGKLLTQSKEQLARLKTFLEPR